MKLRRNVKPLSGPLDITALIDVVLLLIIFFMLSSTFVLQPGIEIKPPPGLTPHRGIRDARYVLNVQVGDPPTIFINDQISKMEKLDREFRSIAREKNDARIVIRADRNVPHGVVTEIMNKVLSAGLTPIDATQAEN